MVASVNLLIFAAFNLTISPSLRRLTDWTAVRLGQQAEISAVPLAGLCLIHCSDLGFAADVNKEPSFISVLPCTLLDSSIPQASEDRLFRKFEIFLPMLSETNNAASGRKFAREASPNAAGSKYAASVTPARTSLRSQFRL
jgi:hypothetical protein